MIYGMIFGISIIIAALTHELIPFYFVLLGGLACMAIVAIVKMQRARKASSPSPPPGSPTSPAPPTPPPPTPAPTPTASSRSWSVWSFVLVFFGGLVALIIYHKVLVPSFNLHYSPPQATAPKKELRKHVLRFPLDFSAGEKVVHSAGTVTISDGGYAIFRYGNLPWRENAKFYVVFSVIRKTTGKHHFEVNKGLGGTFFLGHDASERVETCVFNFDSPGQSQFFHPGENRFKISSPGDEIVIQYSFVQVEYWE